MKITLHMINLQTDKTFYRCKFTVHNSPGELNELNVISEYSENFNVNQLSESFFQDSKSIKNFIANWSIAFNIPHNVVNNLLKGLNKYKCFKYIPVDSKTFWLLPNKLLQN